MKAAHESNWVGVRGGFQPLTVETVQNEVIDPGCRPIRNPGWRDGTGLGGAIGPGLRVFSPLFDPFAEKLFLLVAEILVRVGWWHDFLQVCTENPVNNLTLIWISRQEGIAYAAPLQSSFCSIEPQFALALMFVRSVTGETVVRENRPDIPIEIDLGKKPTRRQDGGD